MALYNFKNSNNNDILPMEIIQTSNGRVLKFSNNIAIAIGRISFTVNNDMSPWGHIFYKEIQGTFGGFSFTESPYIFTSCRNFVSGWSGRNKATQNSFSFEFYRATNYTVEDEAYYMAIGKWK